MYPSFLQKNDLQGAGMTEVEVSRDDGTSQRYSDQDPKTTVRARSKRIADEAAWVRGEGGMVGVDCGRRDFIGDIC